MLDMKKKKQIKNTVTVVSLRVEVSPTMRNDPRKIKFLTFVRKCVLLKMWSLWSETSCENKERLKVIYIHQKMTHCYLHWILPVNETKYQKSLWIITWPSSVFVFLCVGSSTFLMRSLASMVRYGGRLSLHFNILSMVFFLFSAVNGG